MKWLNLFKPKPVIHDCANKMQEIGLFEFCFVEDRIHYGIFVTYCTCGKVSHKSPPFPINESHK